MKVNLQQLLTGGSPSQQHYIMILCVVVVLLLVVLAVLIFFVRRVQKKNRDLQNVIRSLEQKEEIMGNIRWSMPSQPQDVENVDLQEFQEMERIIDEQQIYLNPTASIEMVMEMAGYSRRKSTKLIQQFASTNTRLDYLNQKRVEYAAHLLVNAPSISSKEAGYRSGFYEDSTFRRNFKKYYGVTPAAYRTLHIE